MPPNLGNPSSISRLTVTGKLAPIFAVKLDVKGPTVFAKQVFANGLAAKNGIEAGDVVAAINGKPVRTVEDAMNALGRVGFGDTCNIVIRRVGKSKTIRFTVE